MMSPLRKIFDEITLGSDKWDPYFDVYEQYFTKFIDTNSTFVEVGVQGGGSLEMWRKFFGSKTKIIGIDVDPAVLNNQSEGNKIVIGDQADENFWNKFLEEVPEIDMFVDDGGHYMNQQIITFMKVFPKIKAGGVYVCEDTHTSYWRNTGGQLGGKQTFVEFAKAISDLINYEHIEDADKYNIPRSIVDVTDDIKSVCFYNSMVVFEKGAKPFARKFGGVKKND